MVQKKKVEKKESGKVSELEAKIKELEESKLIVMADFDNFKKRIAKEREELNVIGRAAVLNLLLEILDDLKRAVSEMKSPPDGLKMISQKIETELENEGIEKIDVKEGNTFDPKIMEAIGMLTVKEIEKDKKVIHVERTGYKLKGSDMIVRGCRVIVGKFEE